MTLEPHYYRFCLALAYYNTTYMQLQEIFYYILIFEVNITGAKQAAEPKNTALQPVENFF